MPPNGRCYLARFSLLLAVVPGGGGEFGMGAAGSERAALDSARYFPVLAYPKGYAHAVGR